MYLIDCAIILAYAFNVILAFPPDSNSNPKFIYMMNQPNWLDESGSVPIFVASEMVGKITF